jgi:hypothetical protein
MYNNFKLCDKLKARQICIVVERYGDGQYTREFHEHVPSVRLSNDSRVHLLRALVIRFSPFSAETVVRCHLNGRGRIPPADHGNLRFHITYPEPGVLRSYCGTNILAWSDQVIVPSQFREKS